MDAHAQELIIELREDKAEFCSVSEQDPRLTHKVDASCAHRVDDMFRPHEGVNGTEARHNVSHPSLAIKTEKPIHRLMAYAMACGKSQTEVAEEFGYSKGMVSQIARQRWFMDLVTLYIAEAGEDQVARRLKSAGVDSVETLIELRDSPTTPANVRATVSIHLLDRILGKPSQHIVTEKKAPVDAKTELQLIEQQLAAVKETTKKHKSNEHTDDTDTDNSTESGKPEQDAERPASGRGLEPASGEGGSEYVSLADDARDSAQGQ